MAHSAFHGAWSWRKFRKTPVLNVASTTILCSLWALLIWVIEEHTKYTMQLPASFLSGTVGTVLGFSIALLTSSGKDQYNEGRRLWCTMLTVATDLSQNIWFDIRDHRNAAGRPAPIDSPVDADSQRRFVDSKLEKASMIHLVLAYVVSIKHALRGEPGAFHADLYPLIAWLPHFAGTTSAQAGEADWMPLWSSSRDVQLDEAKEKRPRMTSRERYNSSRSTGPGSRRDLEKGLGDDDRTWASKGKASTIESVLPIVDTEYALQSTQLPRSTPWSDHLPILHLFPWILRKLTRRSFVAENLRRAHRVDVKRTPSNVPLSIHCHLREWFSSCLDAGVIRAPYDGMMAGNLTTLRSVGNDLYRIRTTPTPFAYQAHLRMITILFLIFFPLTMFETLGWSMVFAAALLAFIYFGLLDIARDLENPFGYDPNDLDLDGFVSSIMGELALIMSYDTPNAAHKQILSSYNKPLAPVDSRSAKDIARGSQYHSLEDGVQQLQRVMLERWRAVNKVVLARVREQAALG